MDPATFATIMSLVNIIVPLAAKGAAQISAERGVDPAQVITDSNALDDAGLMRAIAFQAQGHLDGTKVIP